MTLATSIPRVTTRYLWEQVLNHVKLCFTPAASELVRSGGIEFGPVVRASEVAGPSIFIPTDILTPSVPHGSYSVKFGNTELNLWNPIGDALPEGSTPWPAPESPLWVINKHGTLIPAWNLFGNLSDLLTLREERESTALDEHGRFDPTASPRYKGGLLEVPAFNEAVAVLVAGLAGLKRTGNPSTDLKGLVGGPTVLLSHDCDLLRGNDFVTQSIRGYHSIAPLRRGQFPKLNRLWWILENTRRPERYYFQNLLGMIDLERQFGFRSIFYMLNGKGGRFGARSGSALVRKFVENCPEGWEVGLHYNYDTLLDDEAFRAQKLELEGYATSAIVSGRAHYLRFDGLRSPAFVSRHGIRFDESFGYSGCQGYRLGMAGVFRPLDEFGHPVDGLQCLPLHFMDTNMRENIPAREKQFYQRFDHLAAIGGVTSILFHPGNFFNPESPEFHGLYLRMIAHASSRGARSMTPSELLSD